MFDGSDVDRDDLQSMSVCLKHRGPDGEGVWSSGPVGFSHRRLSIIDLQGSPQPMTSADGQLTVCFNGEILNYRELRQASSYPWRTKGDCEVLLAEFAQAGPESVSRLEGQFAYAVHDARRREVWLFRDRMGVLPLYWWTDGRRLLFASEIKALLAVMPGQPAIDRDSLREYLGRRAVRAPHTLLEGVHKLPPGHRLRIDLLGGTSLERWWDLPHAREVAEDTEPMDAVDRVERVLSDAVQRNLVADVPVGCYLSGGVDSSLVTALAAQGRARGSVDTFCAGFGDGATDELPWARQVSRHLGTNHHEVIVTPQDFTELWPLLAWHRDGPLSEPADVAVYALARAARQHVKVVLSGEGSDELFGGYPKHRWAGMTSAVGRVPVRLRAPAVGWLQARLPASMTRPRVALRAMAAGSEEERFAAWFAPFDATERDALAGPPDRVTHAVQVGGDPLRRMLHADCDGWLADNLLERGDRMSMAASLELRPPFLDRRVVETAFRLPSSVKVRRGEGKWVIKQVARRWLPEEVVSRPKWGFRVPLTDWFRESLRDSTRDRLLAQDSFVTSALDATLVERLLDRHDTGRADEQNRIWTLLSLEVWAQSLAREAGPGATTCSSDPS